MSQYRRNNSRFSKRVIYSVFCFVLLAFVTVPLKAEHDPNGYHISSNHNNWSSIYSSTIVGATTANTDGTGVLILCNTDTNSCFLRMDLLGFCTHNGTLPITLTIDDNKFTHRADFSCMGAPVNSPPGYNQAILITNFNMNLHNAMQKGTYIEAVGIDQKNRKISMRASLMGYTAATNAMLNIK